MEPDTSIANDPFVTSSSGFGNAPEVDTADMSANNRVVTSVDQAVQMTETDIQDAKKLVIAARRITAKKQGAPPYNPQTLKNQGKSYKRNISTRFLQKELNRAAPRFYMPLLTASVMVAPSLPAGWPRGQEKTQFYRDTMTRFFRSWRKNDMFWRGLAAEVVDYGFGFAAWTDPYEWRPHLCRMDRGFVPRGTEVMDDKLARFTLKWDYRPDELLKIVRDAIDSGSENWKKDAVANAVDAATLPAMPQDMTQLRKWEELIRENSWDFNYSRSQRMIETRHLYVLEYSGKVSHYILWPDGDGENKLLFEHLDAYDGTDEVVVPVVFGYGDGTIHGSWGCGQLLFDLAAQVEKIRCDSMDNLLNSNKARLQVPNAKDAATAQILINDTTIIATGAQFAQNVGGIAGDPKGYMILDDKMSQWAQEVVGGYLPPIPLQPSDIKAAQVNAATAQEQAIKEDNQEMYLKQCAIITTQMSRRALNPDTIDEDARKLRKFLLGEVPDNYPPPPVSLTEEEIDIFLNQPSIQSVSQFTEYAASKRAAFAASVSQDPRFKPVPGARYMAAGAGDDAFVDSMVIPEGDQSNSMAAKRQQLTENAVMALGIEQPVLVTDLHQVHLEVIKPALEQAIAGGLMQPAQLGLSHAAAHFSAGMNTKTLNPATTNEWKSWLARMQQALEAKTAEVQQQQAMQQGGMGQPPQPAAPQIPAMG
jgi:hypothetical protein